MMAQIINGWGGGGGGGVEMIQADTCMNVKGNLALRFFAI